jgi:hypothetical protein
MTRQEETVTAPNAASPADQAMRMVASAERVSMNELPGGGIAFEVEPGPRDVWKVPLALTIGGAIGIAAGYMLHAQNPGLPEGYAWRAGWKMMGIGALLLGMGPLFLLILVMQGPPRKATVEARPGALRADRSIAGDRVVSSYNGAEILRLFVDESALFATTRKGDQPLISFGNREVRQAIATVLASRLWDGEEIVAGPVPELHGWAILPLPRTGPPGSGVTAPR